MDINNGDNMKKYDNYCIVVSTARSTIKSKYIFNAKVDYFPHYVYMHNILYYRSQIRSCNKKYCLSNLADS